MSMLEDFWLPRREGGKGTEITTLAAGQNLGELADVVYFRQKLLQSLNVPISRLEPQQGGMIGLGRVSEVTRDEVKFAKFVARLRNKFSRLFGDALKIQLALKGICSKEEWDEFIDQLLMFPAKGVHDDLPDALPYIDQLAVTSYFEGEDDEDWEPVDIISGV